MPKLFGQKNCKQTYGQRGPDYKILGVQTESKQVAELHMWMETQSVSMSAL